MSNSYNNSKYYKSIYIKNRNKYRKIYICTDKNVNQLINNSCSEIYKKYPKKYYKIDDIIYYQLPHIYNRYMLKLDIKDYFNSITIEYSKYLLSYIVFKNTFNYLNNYLIKDSLMPGISICGLISNIISNHIKNKIQNYINQFYPNNKFKVSIYVDDILISSNKPFNFKKIIDIINNLHLTYDLKFKDLFKFNESKIRYSDTKISSIRYLGLNLNNNKLTIGSHKKKIVKSIIHRLINDKNYYNKEEKKRKLSFINWCIQHDCNLIYQLYKKYGFDEVNNALLY